MTNIVMYTSQFCPYCVRAKNLLDRKGKQVQEIRVDLDMQKREEMINLSGRTSVPQIFINDEHIGGCDDLYALERAGQLDSKLGLA